MTLFALKLCEAVQNMVLPVKLSICYIANSEVTYDSFVATCKDDFHVVSVFILKNFIGFYVHYGTELKRRVIQ
jgi:hypothetical protein